MVITIHAAERFLERVLSKVNYNWFEINMAIEYLEKILQDVVPSSRSTHFVLPGFKQHKVIYRDNTVITIVPK